MGKHQRNCRVKFLCFVCDAFYKDKNKYHVHREQQKNCVNYLWLVSKKSCKKSLADFADWGTIGEE